VVIDPNDGIGVCRFIHPASVRDIAFSPDGELIATACDDAIARVFSGR
jgi:WD40 repeat protein